MMPVTQQYRRLQAISVYYLLLAQTPTATAYFQDLRLANGTIPNEGRVEILYNNTWGSICDDDWGLNEGKVICRMLGYSDIQTYTNSGHFGGAPKNWPIWLDNVQCVGDEKNITDCNLKNHPRDNIHLAFGDSDCKHHEDAGVVCSENRIEGYDSILQGSETATNVLLDADLQRKLEIRLRPIKSISGSLAVPYIEGFLEVRSKSSSSYRKVCSKNWSNMNSFVACGQLGYPNFGQIDGNDFTEIIKNEEIRLKRKYKKKKVYFYKYKDFNCTGSENDLTWCNYESQSSNCENNTPVYLKCSAPKVQGLDKNLSHTKLYKNIVNFNKGYSRRVSHDRKNGLYNIGIAGNSTFTEASSENSAQMHHRKVTNGGLGARPFVRTRAGPNVGIGRLEILKDGRWGAVCDRNWNIKNANVACRQMGFGTAKLSSTGSKYGPGHNPVWLIDVNCTGFEKDIFHCDHQKVATSHSKVGDFAIKIPQQECSHQTEVSIECNVPDFKHVKKIRLVGGRNEYKGYEGRVEVKIGKNWGSICSDSWSMLEAMVVCKQLGLGYGKTALYDAYFYEFTPETHGEVVMSDVVCDGHEVGIHDCEFKKSMESLKECRKNLNGRPHAAGVICQKTAPDLITDVTMLYKTLHLTLTPVYSLVCAYEEGCLSDSAKDEDWPYGYGQRKLLRFSTRTWNRGTSPFQPTLTPDQWEWHACHRHYHSMEHFIDYDIINKNGKRVAQGLKASFCLEDVDCYGDHERQYHCGSQSRTAQGISVGCADVYQYNLDCQWIDVTDLTAGEYILRLDTNPSHFVGESNYLNNDIICNLHFTGLHATASNCHIPDDYATEYLDQFYAETVFEDWKENY